MSTQPAPSSAVSASGRVRPELLELNLCLGCGYCLGGLPERGICPECAKPFDQSTLFLFGYARATRSTIATAKPWVAFVWATLLFASFIRPVFDGPGNMEFVSIIAGLLILTLIAFFVWRRSSNPTPGTVVVELSPADGCRQNAQTHHENERFTAWSVIDHVFIKMAGNDTCRIQLGHRIGRVRLRMQAVDAEVQCSSEKADLLRKQIQTWIEEAKARLHLNDGGVH